MIGINFDRVKAAHFIESLAKGKPIAHEGDWTIDEMLMLGGACFFAVSTHGTWQERAAKVLGHHPPTDLHPELQEAREETLMIDIHAAVEFCGMLAQKIVDGEYDAQCRDQVQLLLDGDTKQFRPVKGFLQFEK